jgi:acyl carrier protein
MDDKILLKKLEEIMERLYLDVKPLSPSSLLREDLNLDSLDTTEVLMSVEKEFNISIPDDEFEEIKTVADVIKTVQKYLPKTLYDNPRASRP